MTPQGLSNAVPPASSEPHRLIDAREPLSNVVTFPAPSPYAKWHTPVLSLTPRERECVELLHLSNRQIAATLGNRPKTVKALLRSAFFKLGVKRRAEAVMVLERAERRAA